MIFGFFSRAGFTPPPGTIDRMRVGPAANGGTARVMGDGAVAVASFGSGEAELVNVPRVATTRQGLSAVWKGQAYNRGDLLRDLRITGEMAKEVSDAELLLRLYEIHGLSCVEKINGAFAFALFDEHRRELVLGRDRFGIETLYYSDCSNAVVFGSSPQPVFSYPGVARRLNEQALRRYLVFGFNPAWDTFYQGVKKLRPGRLLVVNERAVTERRYWYLSFRPAERKPEPEYCRDILDLMRESIRMRLSDPSPLGIFLSGGMDSSSIAGLTREVSRTPFSSFSYRCLGKSFDESHYARSMARHCGAEHHEVVFQPADVRRMESIVRYMDEPLCNAGITIATFLLGEAAQGKACRIFSGDGGDELFGGHPVYAADRVAAAVDRVPRFIQWPFLGLARALPDSDQKLNLTVKLKRFAESLSYPRELGTYRWRIQYGPAELTQLLQNENGARSRSDDPSLLQDLLELMGEADGPDALSRSLYVDSLTEVNFYLRRMDLVRNFGLTPVFPLLDHRLFEYAASIPSGLKFRDASNTKYIQHRAMEGVLPDEIVRRKDKLGHSIPLKNWLRDDAIVKAFVHDTLSGDSARTRAVVNPAFVQRLWDDHQARRANNSHRLWSLTVLELWLRANAA